MIIRTVKRICDDVTKVIYFYERHGLVGKIRFEAQASPETFNKTGIETWEVGISGLLSEWVGEPNNLWFGDERKC
jgi:hypothetical protein